VGDAPGLKFGGGAYAVEAWVKPKAAGGPVVARGSGEGGGFQLRITGAGQVALDHSGGTLTSDRTIPADTWAHIAASFDGTTATLYIDGAFSGTKSLPSSGDGTALLHIGAKANGPFYSGVIDEVRIWNRARSQQEIADELAYRLIGNEPGLAAYYRFDEGTGTTAHDQTDTAAHANLDNPPQWVTSQAPIGEHPGVRRQSFTFAGREVVSGLAATLYYQQEDAVSGYGGEARPEKRQARVLLACSTRSTGGTAAEAHVASVDFGVGIDGRIADIPDVVTLAELGRPQEQSTDRVSAQQAVVGRLEQQIASLQQNIDDLTADKFRLDAEITAEQAPTDDPYRRALRIQGLRYSSHVLASDPVFSSGSNVLVQMRGESSEEWWLMPLTGVPGRHSNPAVAVVRLGTQPQILKLNTSNNQAMLVPHSLTEPIPPEARWYVHGLPTMAFALQCAVNDWWLWFPLGLYGAGAIKWEDSTAFVVVMKGMVTSPQLAAKIARRNAIPGLIAQSDRDLTAKRVELRLALEELNRLTAGLLGAADLVLPLPHIGLDASGLGCAGGLLKFARTDTTPFLMDGAAGRMTLYFRGGNGQ
ncbi:LamG domain-containing protein, partial [Streptomyces tsukubensis]|uniref:LamG domain-containing protein n=1 Tax=Streptomyces tsukubensis TaxID=83656 RepID=UPI00344D4E44